MSQQQKKKAGEEQADVEVIKKSKIEDLSDKVPKGTEAVDKIKDALKKDKAEQERREEIATIKCPPLKKAGPEFVGKKIKEVRAMMKDDLEIADNAPATVSKDKGDSYDSIDENYVIKAGDFIEFGRGSSTKG